MNTIKQNKILFATFLFLLSTGLCYYLVFFPGIVSADSLDQWNQIVTLNFRDNHPIYHTLFYWWITRIYLSPATISLVQVLAFATIGTYTVAEFKRWGMSNKYIYAIWLILFFAPVAFIMNVILWKDIFSAIFMLWLSILLVKIIRQKYLFLNALSNNLLLFFVSLNYALMRHENIVILIAIFLCVLLLWSWNRKKQVLIYFSIVLCIIGIKQIILHHFDPDKLKRGDGIQGLTTYHLFSIIQDNKELPSKLLFLEEKYHLNKDFWLSHYACDNVDRTYWGVFGSDENAVVKENYRYWHSQLKQEKEELKIIQFAIARYYLTHPIYFLENRLCGAQIVWKPFHLSYNYNYYVNSTDNSVGGVFEFQYILGEKIFDFFAFKFNGFPLIWNPACWLYLFIILSLVLLVKTKNKSYLIITLPILISMGLLFLVNCHQSFRYAYGLVLVAMFFIPFFIFLIKNPRI
jgi:hypothetical protein